MIVAIAAIVPAVSGMEQKNVSVKFDMLYVSDFSFAGDNFVPDGGREQYEGRTDTATLSGWATKKIPRLCLANTHDIGPQIGPDGYDVGFDREYELRFFDEKGRRIQVSDVFGEKTAWTRSAGASIGNEGEVFARVLIGDVPVGTTVKVYSQKYIGMTHEGDGPFFVTRRAANDTYYQVYCSGRGPWVYEGEIKIPPEARDVVVRQNREYDLGVMNYGIR